MKKNIKLIIWDFDGVVADTEKLWLKNRMDALNQKFGLNWDLHQTNHIIGGMSDKTKFNVLKNMGIDTDDDFWKEMYDADTQSMKKGFEIVDGVADIMKLKDVKQCIATGGTMEKTMRKFAVIGFDKSFPLQNLFVADMVEKGKPEPDLFLFACKKMGVTPDEAVVIEDSLAGLTAALKAKILPIAFIGTELNNNSQYKDKILQLGVKHIFDNMLDIKNFILSKKNVAK